VRVLLVELGRSGEFAVRAPFCVFFRCGERINQRSKQGGSLVLFMPLVA
ncbi:hypothetical protein HMPREF1557_00414, partial [Streptococcus sobrinus W1703]